MCLQSSIGTGLSAEMQAGKLLYIRLQAARTVDVCGGGRERERERERAFSLRLKKKTL